MKNLTGTDIGFAKVDDQLVLFPPVHINGNDTQVFKVTGLAKTIYAHGAHEPVVARPKGMRVNSWQLEADNFYAVKNLKAGGAFCSAAVYISTMDGQVRKMSSSEYFAACKARWPEAA